MRMMNLLLTLRNKLGLQPRPALNSLPSVVDFTAKQSAFVSQTTLFGYIKTRAGTSWPKLFEDDTYLVSLRTARSHFFAACVSDLSLFFAARMFRDGQLSAEQAEELAVRIAQQVLITPDIDKHEDIDPDAFQDVVNRTASVPLLCRGLRRQHLRWPFNQLRRLYEMGTCYR